MADCAACHTANGGAPFAGGRAFVLPFGTIYTPNLTPDPETGIGKWTDTDFLNAVHRGIAPDGSRYYPAFPYPSYTLLTDAGCAGDQSVSLLAETGETGEQAQHLRFPV